MKNNNKIKNLIFLSLTIMMSFDKLKGLPLAQQQSEQRPIEYNIATNQGMVDATNTNFSIIRSAKPAPTPCQPGQVLDNYGNCQWPSNGSPF